MTQLHSNKKGTKCDPCFLLAILLLAFSNQVSCQTKISVDPSAQTAIYGVVAIMIGIIFLFFGLKLFKPTLFISGFIIGSLLAYIVLENLCQNDRWPLSKDCKQYDLNNINDLLDNDSKDLWIFLGVCAVVGVICGLLVLFIWKISLIAIGALAGFALSMLILSWTQKFSDSEVVKIGRPILIVVLVVVGAILTYFLEKPMIILGTSLIGAFAVCSGIDANVTPPTHFNAIVKQFISNWNGTVEVDGYLYGLVAAYAILAIIGCLVQFRFYGHYKKFHPVHRV